MGGRVHHTMNRADTRLSTVMQLARIPIAFKQGLAESILYARVANTDSEVRLCGFTHMYKGRRSIEGLLYLL